jgi:hypothetical protein
MALFEPKHQELPWYGNMTRQTLRDQARNAPMQFNLEQFYSNLYNALSNQNYANSLLGTDGGPSTFTWKGTNGRTRTATFDTPASRGLLDLYEKDISPTMQRIASANATATRTADIGDVATLGPQAREALRVSNPEAAALLDKLYGTAMSDLNEGANLNDSEMRLAQQATRAGQSARGMGFGQGDAFAESLNALNYGRGLQQERKANAYQALGGLESFYGDVFNRVLGRPNGTTAMGNNFLGMTGAGKGITQTGMFNANDPLAYNIHAFNANASNVAHNIGQEQWAHMMDQVKDTALQVGGMMAGMGGMGGGSGTSWSSGAGGGGGVGGYVSQNPTGGYGGYGMQY